MNVCPKNLGGFRGLYFHVSCMWESFGPDTVRDSFKALIAHIPFYLLWYSIRSLTWMDESEDEEGSWIAELIAYNRQVFQLQEMHRIF